MSSATESAESTENSSLLPGLIGDSQLMRDVYQLTRRAAASNASVLLLGETGTGKELIATALHQHSSRASGPFVRVNCGALSESLLESELFGHVKGSFTDAVRDRTGRFEAAHTGTIFLDEINSTSSILQVKLLRVLQEREFERVGDTRPVQVDVRVIAASNCDLYQLVDEGEFRADLFWRLNVVPITIPPLRRRREDIIPLVEYFLTVYGRDRTQPVTKIHPDAAAAMRQYNWPGNVRELQNYVERAVVLAETDLLSVELLPGVVTGLNKTDAAAFRGADTQSLIEEMVHNGISAADDDSTDLYAKVVNPVERELISQVLKACNHVQIKAAERLGINRNTLHKKIKEYQIES